MKKPTLQVTSDFTDNVKEIIKRFKKDSVLVGIPETNTERKEDEPINNSSILAINEFGSPANNIPPRPVMSKGIEDAKEQIAEQFKLAAQNALTKGPEALDTYYERAGIIASNSVKKAINSQEGLDPLSKSTLKARERAGFKGTKALIVTGQMRNAITYVVKKGA